MKLFFYIMIAAVLFSSCGKENVYSNDFAAVTFLNASPRTPSINVLIDTIDQTGTGVAYRSASLPLNVRPGSRNIVLRTPNLLVPGTFITYATFPAENFETNTSSTIVNYDTSANGTGPLKTFRLTDNLTTPTAGKIKVRFLPLGRSITPLDVTFLRTSNTATPDSVTITNQTYVGTTPNTAALSAYMEIPAGNYTVKLKTAGTQTVLATTTLVSVVNKGIFTVYTAGGIPGFSLGLSSFRQFP